METCTAAYIQTESRGWRAMKKRGLEIPHEAEMRAILTEDGIDINSWINIASDRMSGLPWLLLAGLIM